MVKAGHPVFTLAIQLNRAVLTAFEDASRKVTQDVPWPNLDKGANPRLIHRLHLL